MALSRSVFRDPFTAGGISRDPFDDFFTSALTPSWAGREMGFPAQMMTQGAPVPPLHLDVKETDNEYQVMADAPGLKKEDFDVTFENNVLRISAERKEEKKEENERYHLQERRWGSVTRSVRLPRDAKGDSIEAKYDQGVLKITVPKSGEQERRKAIRID